MAGRAMTLACVASTFAASVVQAGEVPFTQEDRDRLVRLEATLQEFMKRVDDRFEAVDKRFEAVDKRFEQVDRRFEQVDRRFEQVNERFRDIVTYMGILAGAFAAVVAATIGFAIWDRKTTLAPAMRRVEEVSERMDRTLAAYEEASNRERRIEEALRQFAQAEPRMAEILRRCGVL